MNGLRKKRRYRDGCATAHAMDLVGDRWALLVVRELVLGPKRFRDLKLALNGISANVLTQRLEELEAVGVLRHRELPPPASTWVYELTEWGQESEEIFEVMGRWAARSPVMAGGAPMSVSSVVLSLRTMFDGSRADGVDATLGFRFGAEAFHARIRRGELEIERGDVDGVDVTFEGDQNALAGAVYGGVPLAELERTGALSVTGDRDLAELFVTLFPLPATAPLPE